ncbi:hypothetical protein E2C01_000621 [Portunus trituberculatus]|uniref:Uncharacterized protein n=1 Tax=Portunus trituberculatus TaxID=210409 RepID=A0A5B7CEU6_PORTR|nr:hypothetical protein [Portunus trituberculatus]
MEQCAVSCARICKSQPRALEDWTQWDAPLPSRLRVPRDHSRAAAAEGRVTDETAASTFGVSVWCSRDPLRPLRPRCPSQACVTTYVSSFLKRQKSPTKLPGVKCCACDSDVLVRRRLGVRERGTIARGRREEWRVRGVEADGRQTSSVVERCIQLPVAQGTLVFYFQSPAPVQAITASPLASCPSSSSCLNDLLSPTSPCSSLHPPQDPVPSHLLHAYSSSCPEAPSSLSPLHCTNPDSATLSF